MSDSDAQQDLALTEEDAENVTGGRAVTSKKAAKRASHGSAPITSFTVSGAPLSGDPGVPPGESQAELESDPDC